MKSLEARLSNQDGVPKGTWKLLRDRKDKLHPNAAKTAGNILQSIIEFNMDEDELIEQLSKPEKKLKV